MATKWQKFEIDLPKRYKPSARDKIADKVIDFIVKRTIDKGLDKRNNRFSPYDKQYSKKKGQSKVDLVLSFEMMSSIHLLREKTNKLVIGFEKGSNVNAKADGNIRGTYGKQSPIPGKKRDFLGIFKKDVKKIIKDLGELETHGKF